MPRAASRSRASRTGSLNCWCSPLRTARCRRWSRWRSRSDVAAPSLAAGLASSDNGRPAIAVRQLRAGLRLIGPGGDVPGYGDPAVAEIRARLLVSLAWAESEWGRVDAG